MADKALRNTNYLCFCRYFLMFFFFFFFSNKFFLILFLLGGKKSSMLIFDAYSPDIEGRKNPVSKNFSLRKKCIEDIKCNNCDKYK